ncbi:MAG: OmpH family outer membrane protein [Bacteriovoracaceae bacterium]|nr:OmpH family outer membrane protein [Bacteriovoracaceae bacterium]
MKKIFVCLMLFSLAMPVFAKFVIGQVDVQKVLVSVNMGKKIQKKLQKEFKKKEKELKGKESNLRKIQEDFEKQRLVMNNDAKRKKEVEMQKKLLKLRELSMKYQNEMQSMEQKEKMPILKKIKEIIQTVSKKNAVEFTFETSTTPIVYAKNVKDLTAEIIKEFNKKHPAK